MDRDIRISSNNLLFRRQFRAFLELEISNGTRQGEIAVDTTEVNETTCGANPSFLAYKPFIRTSEVQNGLNRNLPTNLHSAACDRTKEALRDP